jgi:hypothetical protein
MRMEKYKADKGYEWIDLDSVARAKYEPNPQGATILKLFLSNGEADITDPDDMWRFAIILGIEGPSGSAP